MCLNLNCLGSLSGLKISHSAWLATFKTRQNCLGQAFHLTWAAMQRNDRCQGEKDARGMAKTSHGSCTIFEGVCGNWEGSWLAKTSWLKPTISLKTSVPRYQVYVWCWQWIWCLLQYLDLICEHAVFEWAVVLLVVNLIGWNAFASVCWTDANPLSPTFSGT